MRLICGILQPTNGSITCDNIRISDMGTEYRRLLGYLPQDFGYYGDFTAVRFLNYMATLKALPRDYAKGRVEELLELVDLKDVKNKKLKTYSGGMLRRIGIAQALLNDLHHSVSTYKLTAMTKTVRYNRWEIIVHIFVTRDFFHFILLSFPVYQHICDTLR